MIREIAPRLGGVDNLGFCCWNPAPSCSAQGGGLNYPYRIKRSDVAVKESSELRLRKRAHPGGLDVAVLEQHQRRDSPDAELGRHALVLVDVDLRALEAAFVLLGDLVQDRRDRLARAAPSGPIIDQYRCLGLEDLRIETLVGHVLNCLTAHGSPWGAMRGKASIMRPPPPLVINS